MYENIFSVPKLCLYGMSNVGTDKPIGWIK